MNYTHLSGTVTANGVPLLMSDMSATNGVAHIVADVIPSADIGSDPNQIQSSLFNFIHNGGLETSRNGFQKSQEALQDAQFRNSFRPSVLGKTSLNVGVPLPPSVPVAPSGLYETPIETFNFGDVSTVAPISPADAGVPATESGDQYDSFTITSTSDVPQSTTSFDDQQNQVFQSTTGNVVSTTTFGSKLDTTTLSDPVVVPIETTTNEQTGIILEITSPQITTEYESTTVGFGDEGNEYANTPIVTIQEHLDKNYNVESNQVSGHVVSSQSDVSESDESGAFDDTAEQAAPAPPPFIGLYSAPQLSAEQRRDPFSSPLTSGPLNTGAFPSSDINNDFTNVVDTQFNTDDVVNSFPKSLLDNWRSLNKLNNNIASSKNMQVNDIPADNVLKVMKKLKMPNPANGNPSFSVETNDGSIEHESFFIVTKADLDLEEILGNLDENIKKDIHILESPSIFVNSSMTGPELQASLTDMLLNQMLARKDHGNSFRSLPIHPEENELPVFRDSNVLTMNKIPESTSKTSNALNMQSFMLNKLNMSKVSDEENVDIDSITKQMNKLVSDFLDKNRGKNISIPMNTISNNQTRQLIELLAHQMMLNEIRREQLKVPSVPQINSFSLPSHGVPLNVNQNKFDSETSTQSQNAPRIAKLVQKDTPVVNLLSGDKNKKQINVVSAPLANNTENDRSISNVRPNVVKVSNSSSKTNNIFTVISSVDRDELDAVGLNTDIKTDLQPISDLLKQDALEEELQRDTEDYLTLDEPSDYESNLEFDDIIKFNNTIATTTAFSSAVHVDSSKRGGFLSSSTGRPLPLPTSNSTDSPPTPAGIQKPKELQPEFMHLFETSDEIVRTLDDIVYDDDIPSSQEQEMNVLDFLRMQNLTAFADMVAVTGLNRDMIRGGEMIN